jgi:hypothetical protein
MVKLISIYSTNTATMAQADPEESHHTVVSQDFATYNSKTMLDKS